MSIHQRYDRRVIHRRLGGYFHGASAGLEHVPARTALELCHALERSGASGELAEALAGVGVLMALYDGTDRFELLGCWARLGDEYHPEVFYRRALLQWSESEPRPERQLLVRGTIARLLEDVGCWQGAIELQRECLQQAARQGDRAAEADARHRLGVLMRLRGGYDEAWHELTRARAIYAGFGDRRGAAAVTGHIGVIHVARGEFDRALECFQEQSEVCRQLGDHAGLASATGNIGTVYLELLEFDRALVCFQQLETLFGRLGDRTGIASVMSSMGHVYGSRRDYEQALECFRQQEAICRELGDRYGLTIALGNIGTVYRDLGEHERALECYRQDAAICDELGDRHGLSATIGNIANVYLDIGEYDRALECFRRQEAICREVDDRIGVYSAIGNIGLVYLDRGEPERALPKLWQAAEEHRQIGYLSWMTLWLAEIANALLQFVEHYTDPPECLAELLPDARGDAWQAAAMRLARQSIESCLSINQMTGSFATKFDCGIHLARIDMAEGNHPDAADAVEQLLIDAESPRQRVEAHYMLWRLARTAAGAPSHDVLSMEQHRVAALQLYRELYETMPKHEYRKRMDELRGGIENPAPGDVDATAE